MEDVIDLIAINSSASDVSDKIKEILFSKAAERIDAARPYVAADMFGESDIDYDVDEEETDQSEEQE
jgi:hypothetical protein